MADANFRAANPANYQLPGRVSLWFRKAGQSGAADWKEFGNIINPAVSATIERLEHFSQRRGQRAKDRIVNSQREAQLNFSIDEINVHNLAFAFGQSGEATTGSMVLNESKVFENPGSGGTIALGDTDIEVGSVVVRDTFLGDSPNVYASGTDYTLNVSTGVLTIDPGGDLASGGAAAELHIFYQKEVETKKFEIFDGGTIEGEAKFQILTPDGLQVAYEFGNVSIVNNGDITIGDGTAFQEIGLTMEILVDDDGVLGTCHVIEEGEL